MELDETVGAGNTAAARPSKISQAQAAPASTGATKALLLSQCVSCILYHHVQRLHQQCMLDNSARQWFLLLGILINVQDRSSI